MNGTRWLILEGFNKEPPVSWGTLKWPLFQKAHRHVSSILQSINTNDPASLFPSSHPLRQTGNTLCTTSVCKHVGHTVRAGHPGSHRHMAASRTATKDAQFTNTNESDLRLTSPIRQTDRHSGSQFWCLDARRHDECFQCPCHSPRYSITRPPSSNNVVRWRRSNSLKTIQCAHTKGDSCIWAERRRSEKKNLLSFCYGGTNKSPHPTEHGFMSTKAE